MEDTEQPSSRAKWPEHIAFKAHSNFFVGLDGTALFKTMVSIRTMVGIGMVVGLFLPTTVLAVVAALMTLPQLFLTLAHHYRIIQDPLRKAHPVLRGRYAGEIDGDFCVFHIGVILNGYIPNNELKALGNAFIAMNKELESDPEKYGFYGSTQYVAANPSVDTVFTVQYWKSQEHLNAYARDLMSKHFPAIQWSSRASKLSAHIGFWHESFTVHAGEYEALYINCPQILLGKAGRVVPATGHKRTARGRLGLTDGNDIDHDHIID